MCLIIPKTTPLLTAEQNIEVYKLVRLYSHLPGEIYSGYYESVDHPFGVKYYSDKNGLQPKIKIEETFNKQFFSDADEYYYIEYRNDYEWMYIGKGYHSSGNLEELIEAVGDVLIDCMKYINMFGERIELKKVHTIVKCIIPTGSQYYRHPTLSMFVSDSIVIDVDNKTKRYWEKLGF